MDQEATRSEGWLEVLSPLLEIVDLDATAQSSGAFRRRRGVPDAATLLRLALAWAVCGLSLRQAATWAGISGMATLGDGALSRRLQRCAVWLEHLVQAVLRSRTPAARGIAEEGRLIRLVDGTTFGVVGAAKPGWRLHTGFDLPAGRMGGLTLTGADEGEGLARVPVEPGELCIADRGFARPEGLRHVIDRSGDFLIRIGSRSLKLLGAHGHALDLPALTAGTGAIHDLDVQIAHGRKGRRRWPPLAARLIIAPLPPAAAEAARQRLRRAGQRESYTPSPQAFAAAGHIMLITSLPRDAAEADALLDLYRLRWQVEIAFKRLKSLLGMRRVPVKDPDSARTWLYANLLVALLAEDFSAEFGDSSP